MSVSEKIHLFRMVHWENVEYILRNGLCCREHANSDPNYINIGHRQLITDRHDHPIAIPGAGNLGEYVPFYFAGHSPMLYLIMNGFKGVEKRPQDDIVYFVSDFSKIEEAGLKYIFTDMNAKLAVVNFFNDKKDFDKLKWDIVKNSNWKNDENNIARQDYKQAEFLVRSHVPIECITHLVLKTSAREDHYRQLINDLNLDIEVVVDNNCKLYY